MRERARANLFHFAAYNFEKLSRRMRVAGPGVLFIPRWISMASASDEFFALSDKKSPYQIDPG
ncbi:unnamed protein product, partial [Trichogramma brassicae]